MQTAPLTDTKLRRLQAPEKRIHLHDGQVRGLVLRVTPAGTKTWAFECRVRAQGETLANGKRAAGPKQRFTLGDYPSMSIAEARAGASQMLALARRGVDPSPKLAPPKEEPKPEVTVGQLIDRFAEQHLRRNLRSGDMVEKLLRAHVESAWGSRPVAELRRGDLVTLLERVRVKVPLVNPKTGGQHVRGGPVAAASVRKWVSTMWNWAVAHDLTPDNVMEKVTDPDRQRFRTRYLSMDELRATWAATKELPSPWRELYQLLILTGQRRDEWASARWDWIDADVTRLEIPADHYKSGRPHVVPLSRQAQEIVRTIPRLSYGPYLITTSGGHSPVSGFSKAKEQLDGKVAAGRMTVAPFVVHDLRRTMATQMERLGVEPHIIEACLGHALKGIERVYRHFTYYDQKATALQRWADEVTGGPSTQGS
jgi:integrase